MDAKNTVQLLEIVAALAGIFTAICSAIVAIRKKLKGVYKRATYYVSRGVFADRVQMLRDLTDMLRSNYTIINVYGKRGIGKSAFLRFFCDFTNHKLNRENRKQRSTREGIRPPHGVGIYIHITGEGTSSIDSQIVSQVIGLGSTLPEIAKNLPRKIKRRKILIVIDNINNPGLSKEVEGVIDTFFSYSQRYRIIVGSIEKQPFLNVADQTSVGYIELPLFVEEDVFDFAQKNAKGISSSYITKIIEFSDGLPVFVSLLLSNQTDILSEIAYDTNRMERYLGRIIDDLDPHLHSIAIYIGFLSITNSVVPICLLREVGASLSDDSLKKLESYSLVEYDRERQVVKMHELFRNYITQRLCSAHDIIRNIYEYYQKINKIYEQAYYAIISDLQESDGTVRVALTHALKEENYAFLIMLGEHYKRVYGWQSFNTKISEELFLLIVYGYIEGLAGVGNYPAAREVVDKCKIAARTPSSEIQFLFSLSTAQLYHLQNNYDEAIASFAILLQDSLNNVSFKKYEAKCFWGIAHALRHEGKDFERSIGFYDNSIIAARRLNRKSELIKSMREKLTLLLLRNQKQEARELHHQLCLEIKTLPPKEYVSTRLSFFRTEALYLCVLRKNPQLGYKLLSNVLEEYKVQRKRLQYNVYFQLGEHFRHSADITQAKECYNKALAFSRKNYDHNLETMSQIALAICGLLQNRILKADIECEMTECINTCDEYNLYTNKLLAEVVLAYAQDSDIDESTIRELERLKYANAVSAARNMCSDSLSQLDLFLM